MAKNFTIISGEDWAESAKVTDDETGGPATDVDTAIIELQVQDDCGNVVLSAGTADNSILRPESGVFTWHFPYATVSAALKEGRQYKVACRMNVSGAITMLFLTSLVVQETGFSWK